MKLNQIVAELTNFIAKYRATFDRKTYAAYIAASAKTLANLWHYY